MKLHDLKPQPGEKKNRKRICRGIAAGQGKTGGRGTKGQGARSGGSTRLYHQGGNLPFFRRLPFIRGKGFTPFNRVEFNEVNLDQLKDFQPGNEVSPATLENARLLRDPRKPIVLMGRGDISIALQVQVHRITKNARSKVEAAGGKVDLIERK